MGAATKGKEKPSLTDAVSCASGFYAQIASFAKSRPQGLTG